MGERTSHPLPFAKLWLSCVVALKQQAGGFARGRRAAVAEFFIRALGLVCDSPVWWLRHFGRGLDLATFSRLSCNTTRYEGRGRSFLFRGRQSTGWTWMALFAIRRRGAWMATLCCRSL